MSAAYLGPFWQLLFALSMMLFVVAAVKWRSALYARRQYLPLVVLFLFPFGFFLMSHGVAGTSATLRGAAPLLMAGTGVLFVAALLLVAVIAKLAREGNATGGSKP